MEMIEEYPDFFVESSVFGFFLEDEQEEEIEDLEGVTTCKE